jgi:hypothetical protein
VGGEDDLTEWLSNLLTSVTRIPDQFQLFYDAVSSSADAFTPEQVVLLHSLEGSVDGALNDPSGDKAFVTLSLLVFLAEGLIKAHADKACPLSTYVRVASEAERAAGGEQSERNEVRLLLHRHRRRARAKKVLLLPPPRS